MLKTGCYCDQCGKEYSYTACYKDFLPSKAQLIRLIRVNGWSVGKYILCPNCRRKKKVSE